VRIGQRKEFEQKVAKETKSFDEVEEIRQVDEKGTLSTELLPGLHLAVATIFER
jgi:hypothetical protein